MSLFLIASVVIIFDQITKYLVRNSMCLGETIPLIPNFFHITHVQNPGAAFGILAYQTSFFILIGVLVIFFIFYFWRQLGEGKLLLKFALSLQLGGAIGNLIDRIYFGQVTDFFDFRVFPVFNIADIAITVGVGLLCLEILLPSFKKQVEEQK
ncbi:MAG: signal peptidase II [Bacillota bacterium]